MPHVLQGLYGSMNRAVPNDVQLKTAPVLLCKVSFQRIKAKHDLPPSSTGVANLQAVNNSYWYPALCVGRFVSNPNDSNVCDNLQTAHSRPITQHLQLDTGEVNMVPRNYQLNKYIFWDWVFTCGLPTNTPPLSPLPLHQNPSPQRLTFWDLFGRTAWEQHSFGRGELYQAELFWCVQPQDCVWTGGIDVRLSTSFLCSLIPSHRVRKYKYYQFWHNRQTNLYGLENKMLLYTRRGNWQGFVFI